MKTTPASNMDVKRRDQHPTLYSILRTHFPNGAVPAAGLELVELELGELAQSVMGDECAGGTLLGVGISLPGIVDSEAGLLRYFYILDLRNVPLDMR